MAEVPAYPGELSEWERHWWQELWRLPIAATWGLSERPLVGVLAKLYARTEEEGVSPGFAGQIASISAQLGLNPTARERLHVELDTGDRGPNGRSRRGFEVA